MKTTKLLPAADDASLGILQPDAPPAVVGEFADGVSYSCHQCAVVLVDAVGERQLWDVAIRCPLCLAVGTTAPLPAGQATGSAVLVEGGRFRLGMAVRLPATAVIVGPRAIRQRLSETGRGLFADTRRPRPPARPDLAAAADHIKERLGPTYERIRAAYEKGKASSTPPAVLHRLPELLDAVDLAARISRLGVPTVDPVASAELLMVAELFEAWSRNPEWPDIRTSLESTTKFDHDIIVLMAATFLSDSGNDVSLVPARGAGRNVDLHIRTTATDYVRIEVKAPRLCRGPLHAPIDRPAARRIVQKAVNDAGMSEAGQLAPDAPGVLVIGGFHLSERDVVALEHAANFVVAQKMTTKPHIMGISLIVLGVAVHGVRSLGPGGLDVAPGGSISPTVQVLNARNPSYVGGIGFSEGRRAALRTL